MPEERLIKWASKAWKGGGDIADITDIPATAFQICLRNEFVSSGVLEMSEQELQQGSDAWI